MSKIDTQNINVLNYNENEVFVDSSKEHYKFNASRDGKTPSVIPVSLSELQNICSNTDIIVTGWLTFDDDVKEEVFKELRIANWQNILSNEDIADILTNPTMEGLQKIIDIENQTYFDRVRIIMFKLMKQGVDITTKVSRIVEQRYDELRNRQRKSSIVDEMKKMMEQMMSMQNTSISTASENTVKEDIVTDPISPKKKAGRPKKSTT